MNFPLCPNVKLAILFVYRYFTKLVTSWSKRGFFRLKQYTKKTCLLRHFDEMKAKKKKKKKKKFKKKNKNKIKQTQNIYFILKKQK